MVLVPSARAKESVHCTGAYSHLNPALTPSVLMEHSALLNTHRWAIAASLAASGERICPVGPLGQLSYSPVVWLGRAGEKKTGASIISCLVFPSQ